MVRATLYLFLAAFLVMFNSTSAEVPTTPVTFLVTEQVNVSTTPAAVEEARITVFANNLPVEKLATTNSEVSTNLPSGTYLVIFRTETCKTARVIEIENGEPLRLEVVCQQQ